MNKHTTHTKRAMHALTSAAVSAARTSPDPQYRPCPCGGADYKACCGRFITQQQQPHTPEELMRSRYTAYTLGDEAWVRATWYPRSLPEGRLVSNEPGMQWLGLEIRRHTVEGDEGIVEFVARYKIGGRAQRMHEVSRFVREEGRWYYLDGSFPERNK